LTTTTELARLLPDLLPRLWTFAWRITGDRLDAEELTHKTCLRAWQRVEPAPDGVQPIARLYAIAYRIWIDELRSQGSGKRTPPRKQDDAQRDAFDAARDASSQIVAAVDQLPHAQRMAMLLVAVEAFSYAEAAYVLAVPVNTVASRVVRAREVIGRQLAALPEQYRKRAAR
jgi:RNA polymerase sigma-70 factor, ECF subfamily